ncbi:HesA/MoeB/ThiF family protein [Psychrilyobacter atlanticus]|uniref:HesA/MoeB/ThiF family protein n=1 Tax=Psychrilyobacter atlanticus TaxID=271091 RepID=UPI00041FEC2F|nr:HesA/MoeB/ThiF family protein [Psychrilyobacter atlanticus]
MDRYSRNKKMISTDEQKKLSESTVVILGVGGLGGYALEMLARVGVGKLLLVDFDKFEVSNLNRQIISTEGNLGLLKVEEARKRVEAINPEIEVVAINKKISDHNIDAVIKGADIVVDALDSSTLKKVVEKSCARNKIPMVHGAIGGWIAQVAVIMPGDFILDKIYSEDDLENKMGNPSFTPALAASIQVGEVIKFLLNKGELLNNEVLYIDLEYNSFTRLKV